MTTSLIVQILGTLLGVAGTYFLGRVHGASGGTTPAPDPAPAGSGLGGILGVIGPQLLQGFEQLLLQVAQDAGKDFLAKAAQSHLLPALTAGTQTPPPGAK